MDEWSRLLVSCRSIDYSTSALVRALEDVDASVVNLNIVRPDRECDPGMTYVDLRITHRSPDAAMRSLARHGFDVILCSGSHGMSDNDDSLRQRIDELMYMINM